MPLLTKYTSFTSLNPVFIRLSGDAFLYILNTYGMAT